MKKSLLALFTSTLFIGSGSALAAFADAPQGEGAGTSAQLEITGTLTSTAPHWAWQINSASEAGAKDLGFVKGTGTENGNSISYTSDRSFLFLQGKMINPASVGAPGLQPEITIGTTKVLTSGGKQAIQVPIAGTRNGTATRPGTLNLIYENVFATIGKNASGALIVDHSAATTETSSGAYALLAAAIAELKANNTSATEIAVGTSGESFDLLANTTTTNISSALNSKISGIRAAFVTSDQPDTWTANLPVTITLK